MRALSSCFLSFSGKLIWKMSLLVSDEILGVLVYVFTADGKCHVQGFENLQLRNEMQFSEKRKTFLSIFCCISGIYTKFWTFWKKRWSSSLMYFRNYRLWKSLLENSLKSTVSGQALAVNLWKRPKYLRNLNESDFVMFFIILRDFDLENVSPSVRWNVRGVC